MAMIGPLIYEKEAATTKSINSTKEDDSSEMQKGFNFDRDLVFDAAELQPELLSSAIGSFFKGKYEDPLILHEFCSTLLSKYKANLNHVNGIFLKFLIERLMQLGYGTEEFYEYEKEYYQNKYSSIG